MYPTAARTTECTVEPTVSSKQLPVLVRIHWRTEVARCEYSEYPYAHIEAATSTGAQHQCMRICSDAVRTSLFAHERTDEFVLEPQCSSRCENCK